MSKSVTQFSFALLASPSQPFPQNATGWNPSQSGIALQNPVFFAILAPHPGGSMRRFPLIVLALAVIAVLWMVWPHTPNRDKQVHDQARTIHADTHKSGTRFSIPATASNREGRPLATANCEDTLPNQTAPTFEKKGYTTDVEVLCLNAFSVLASHRTRTGLWSAEHLTPDKVAGAEAIPRVNRFHPESRLDPANRAENRDYANSGFDKGHLTPAGDMRDADSQTQSFSLANMAPQAPKLNRGAWAHLEEHIRKDVKAGPDGFYVITGVLFEGAQTAFIHDRVAVPSAFYKLVYDARTHQAVVFVADNTDTASIAPQAVSAFEAAHGVDFHLGSTSTLSLDF
jgi:endonuclease G